MAIFHIYALGAATRISLRPRGAPRARPRRRGYHFVLTRPKRMTSRSLSICFEHNRLRNVNWQRRSLARETETRRPLPINGEPPPWKSNATRCCVFCFQPPPAPQSQCCRPRGRRQTNKSHVAPARTLKLRGAGRRAARESCITFPEWWAATPSDLPLSRPVGPGLTWSGQ